MSSFKNFPGLTPLDTRFNGRGRGPEGRKGERKGKGRREKGKEGIREGERGRRIGIARPLLSA